MKRIHLFEIEDQQWFPGFLRDYMTDFLQFLSNKTKIYRPVVGLLAKKLKETESHTMVDLASGGGGGLLWINQELQREIPDLKIILTDFYPNIPAFEHTKSMASNFDYVVESIDARNVPSYLKGFRTQFLSFHHFRPDDAQKILQNAVDSKSSIAIFEAQDRSLQSFIGMLLSPLSVFFTTPFIRPFKLGRIVFTYIIPIVPICVLWDGLVSCFRTYSIKEMESMIKNLENKDTFEWEMGIKKEKGAKISYLLGTHKKA